MGAKKTPCPNCGTGMSRLYAIISRKRDNGRWTSGSVATNIIYCMNCEKILRELFFEDEPETIRVNQNEQI